MDNKRSADRVVPRRPVTVAVARRGAPVAYGVVENISEGGACVVTDSAYPVGQWVALALSFPRVAQLFETQGRIVWLQSQRGPTVRWGLQFSPGPEFRQAQLNSLIGKVDQ